MAQFPGVIAAVSLVVVVFIVVIFVVVDVVICMLQLIMPFCVMLLKNAVFNCKPFSLFLFRHVMECFAATDSNTRLKQQLSIHVSLPLIILFITENFVCFWCDSPQWARASSFTRFLDHTQPRTTVGSTPLYE